MVEKQKASNELINFFAEHLKHHKIEQQKRKLLEIQKEFTIGEELFNSISHSIGALLSIAGLILLIIKAEGATQVTGVTIFASSAILMYIMSTIHHSFPPGKTKNVFERLDHSSMYLLVAGTYTPLCLIVFPVAGGWVLFGIQWGLAISGIILKSIWVDRFDFIHLIFFLIMGWAFILFIGTILNGMSLLGFIFLLVGGICYSVGSLFYIFTWFKFHHGLWHLFLLAGTICQFFAMLDLLNYTNN